jgi:homoserine O-acetyltransferase
MPTEPDPTAARPPAAHPAVAAEGVLDLPGMFPLHLGGQLRDLRVGWCLEGAAGAPVVVALGGISAHRRIFAPGDRRAGWWPELAGPGLPLDSDRFRLLGIDYLGGSGASTGPAPGELGFPAIDARDQARLIARVADHLGLPVLHAIAGASYGGMVALAFGELFPHRVGRLLVISGAHRTNPLATAWRSVQREAVRFGVARGDGAGGLRLARALAMATYRTRDEFTRRFGNAPRLEDGRATFPVEEYLFARGDDYATRYRPESFLCLSQSIDLQQVEPARVPVPAVLVAVGEDQLVTLDDMRELDATLAGPHRLFEIQSHFGHDAFLKERAALAPAFALALDGDLR